MPLATAVSVDLVDSAALLELVAREFESTGAGMPSWPDPHPHGDSPRDEEYSHTLDPAKYRVVGARAEAWARVLESCGLARREPVADVTAAWRPTRERVVFPPTARGEWLRPHVEGGIPLLFVLGSVHSPDNHLDVGAGEPAVWVVSVPFCGCDACDDGSAHFLDEIDRAVLSVVSGVFIYLRLGAVEVRGWSNGWSAGGGVTHLDRRDIETAIADVRGGHAPRGVLHGPPWWS
jgi:hypothetical protein